MAHIEGGRVVSITNNPNGDPHMAGCIKGLQMSRVLYAPDRLKKPRGGVESHGTRTTSP